MLPSPPDLFLSDEQCDVPVVVADCAAPVPVLLEPGPAPPAAF